MNAHANSNGSNSGDQSQGSGHTRYILPRADIGKTTYPITLKRWDFSYPLDLRHLFWGVGTGLPTYLPSALLADPLTAAGAAGGIGLTAAVGSAQVDRTINKPMDIVKNSVRKVSLSRAFPMGSDQLLNYWGNGVPIHGIKRIYDDGTVERFDGSLFAFIGMAGPNMENETDSIKESTTDGTTSGIRTSIEGDFCWYMTTAEEAIDATVQKYRDAVQSDRFGGPEFELLREYLYDKIEHEQTVEPSIWRTREMLSYAVVEVSPSTNAAAKAAALDRADSLREYMPGMGTDDSGRSRGSESHSSRLSRKHKNRLDDHVSNMMQALTSTRGVDKTDVYQAGPTEVSMLAADYWGGIDIDTKLWGADAEEGPRIPAAVDLAVFPSADEAMTGEGPRSHRPTPVERRLEKQYQKRPGSGFESEAERLIAGIDRIDDLTDGVDESVTEDVEMQSPDTDDVDTPSEAFDDEGPAVKEIAQYATELREFILGDSGHEVDADTLEREASGEPLPEEQAITPNRFKPSEDGEYLKVGDEYVKTFWVTGWTPSPQPDLLEGLKRHEELHPDPNSAATDAKFNVCIRVKQLSRKDAKHYLSNACRKLGIEINDNADEIDSWALDSKADYYRMMAFILETRPAVRPWWVNGYVTVRAGTKQGIEEAREQLKSGYADDEDATRRLGREDILEDTEKNVLNAIRTKSPGLTIKDEPGRIDELFASGFPTSRDHYDNSSGVNKYQLSFTGPLGAMYPFREKLPQEPDGIEYGRHRATGLKLSADPFSRGSAPHGIGIGDSGSSKTFSIGKRYLQWWAAKEGRTVVFCDTMGEFTQHVRAAGPYGNHVRVDGNTTINPFAISEVTGRTLGDNIQPGEKTFNAAQEWLLGEVAAQGGNPDRVRQTVEQLMEKMYQDAGIDIDDPSTFGNGNPNTLDFIETMDELEANPLEATLGESGSEADSIVEEIKYLKRNLSGFSKLGRNSHMLGESDVSLETGCVNYLDLSAIEDAEGGASTSAMLQLMLKQVYEVVKTAPEETVFVIDEAHLLLQTDWSLKWISQSGRHWRHFLGRILAISHRPDEFQSGPEDPKGHKDNIVSQAATKEFWNVEHFDRDEARPFFEDSEGNFNEEHYKFVKEHAETGDSDKPYSTSIVSFTDYDGWFTNNIRTGSIVEGFHAWDPGDHGKLEPYMQYMIDGGTVDEYELFLENDELPEEYITGGEDDIWIWSDDSVSRSPDPAEPAVAATDGGNTETPPRDEKGRFISPAAAGGDD